MTVRLGPMGKLHEEAASDPLRIADPFGIEASDGGPPPLQWRQASALFLPVGQTVRAVVLETRQYGCFLGFCLQGSGSFTEDSWIRGFCEESEMVERPQIGEQVAVKILAVDGVDDSTKRIRVSATQAMPCWRSNQRVLAARQRALYARPSDPEAEALLSGR